MPNPICFEPTVAVDSGHTIFVMDASGRFLARSSSLGYVQLPGPATLRIPPGPTGDATILVDRSDRLWYYSFTGAGNDRNVHVARSEDGGSTWTLNHVVPVGLAVDRPWMVVNDDTVWMFFNDLDAGLAVMVSVDAGASFSLPAYYSMGNHLAGIPSLREGQAIIPFIEGGQKVVVGQFASNGSLVARTAFKAPRADDFPAAVDANGSLVVSWRTGSNIHIFNQRSNSTQVVGNAITSAVLIQVADGVLAVFYGGSDQVLQSVLMGSTRVTNLSPPLGEQSTTDFPHAVHTGGQLLATFTDGQAVYVTKQA